MKEQRMDRKRLIFFVSSDPRTSPRPAGQAYHFAAVAARAGLDAEVRLAGDAVRVAQLQDAPDDPDLDALRDKAREGVTAPYLISL
jgi:predicted peroxiredoxin